MGTKWQDYLKEAHRTLKPYGHSFIAEPHGKWEENGEKLRAAVQAAVFRVMGDVEQQYSFVYLAAVKA